MPLFLSIRSAQKGDMTHSSAGVGVFASKAEALGSTMIDAAVEWPKAEGWTSPTVSAAQVPEDIIRRAYAELPAVASLEASLSPSAMPEPSRGRASDATVGQSAVADDGPPK